MQRAHEVLGKNGVSVLAISIDGTGVQAARPVIDEGKYSFVVPVDQSMAIARQFGVRGVPMTYVVDRNGMILAQGFGPMDLDSAAFLDYVRSIARRGA
ncbi:MAG: TlpA family protein disulfide reductase [Burkholderiales bacterium]|nr:TlpA family protein disulfide reductase [Burkholderiales bacterium]